MPRLSILTNIPRNKIPKDFVTKVLPILSKVVNKPIERFICVISGDCQLSLNGDSDQPGAVATLESIGNLGVKENEIIARSLTEYVEKELGVDKDRFSLMFYDLEPFNVAIGGATKK